MEQVPSWMCRTLHLLSWRADSSVLHGLPFAAYDMERGVLSAFRCLQMGSNTGKVVVRVPSLHDARVNGWHLVSGGRGGLGLITGHWLAGSGAD
eukprot:scaffold11995_cov124-Isochrysis_galbana.AAC.1